MPPAFSIEVFDNNGKLVFQTSIADKIYILETEIYSNGAYLIKVATTKHLFTKKFIKIEN